MKWLILVISNLLSFNILAADIFIETESFEHKGGWVVDQQFIEQMGSSYLLAHGFGKPVSDAYTNIDLQKKGKYFVYVRTYNWTSPWTSKPGPGKFKISVAGDTLESTLGDTGNKWFWQYAGSIELDTQKNVKVSIHDITGFDGRLDAIYLTTRKGITPPDSGLNLARFRNSKLKIEAPTTQHFDLVVIGGGTAGICAAISAARNGLKVALINNRPILGGNNSSDVRVHLGGQVNIGKYPNLGNIVREFGPSNYGNAQDANYYEDDLKLAVVKAEKNIQLFLNYNVFKVEMKDKHHIRSVLAKNIETSKELKFESPLFVDCTGDGSVGFMAGADFMEGTESYDTFKESRAPKDYTTRTMGVSIQWNTKENSMPTSFPEFNYGVNFTDKTCERRIKGDWNWETGMNYDKITQAERIRDYGMLVVYSNWSYLKNELKDNSEFLSRDLNWVAFIAGKRESRRLVGDLILTQNDLDNYVEYPDGTAASSWTIDLHYPDPDNSTKFPGEEFKSIAKHSKIYPYPIPYRCMYSRNIENLFMAGRDISVSHIALGTVRVMRTTAMMGEVVGLAASVCKNNNCKPRDVYSTYFTVLDKLLQKGAGKLDVPDNQKYNIMEVLKEKPANKK